jgi:hypothetical protein
VRNQKEDVGGVNGLVLGAGVIAAGPALFLLARRLRANQAPAPQ